MKVLKPLLAPTASNTDPGTRKKFYLCLILVGLASFYLLGNLNWVVTPSIDATLLRYSDKPFEHGDYVTFTLTHELANKGQGVKVTKKLVCLPGDILTIKSKLDFYCNDVFLGTAFEYSPDIEQHLPIFDYQGVIPENNGFVTGNHKKSFDSRNWGFIDLRHSQNNWVIL